MSTTMQNQLNQNHYMGKSITCSPESPSYIAIVEALYVMTYECSKKLSCPRGFHLRIRLTPKMTMRTFSARIGTFYKRKSNYIPLRIATTELDPEDGGQHQHIALILDGKLDRKASLQYFMAELKSKGFLYDYIIIPPRSDAFGQDLTCATQRDHYFKWLGYICKTHTKPSTGQVWSCCRTISSAVKEWKKTGRPSLTKSDQGNNDYQLPCASARGDVSGVQTLGRASYSHSLKTPGSESRGSLDEFL